MEIFSILSQLLVDHLSGEDKQDVLDSMLLAQLTAKKKKKKLIGRSRQKKGIHTIEMCYKMLVGSSKKCQFTKYNTILQMSTTFTMDKVALELLAQIAGQAETDMEVH